VLTIEVRNLFGDVVDLALESAHATLQLVTLATNSRQLFLLLSQLCFTLLLRRSG
jgi:hypothetical protein